jgi:hypothetical protein
MLRQLFTRYLPEAEATAINITAAAAAVRSAAKPPADAGRDSPPPAPCAEAGPDPAPNVASPPSPPAPAAGGGEPDGDKERLPDPVPARASLIAAEPPVSPAAVRSDQDDFWMVRARARARTALNKHFVW